MAGAEKYAQWIVDNQDKKGTPEFETVAQAYQLAKQQPTQRTEATATDRTNAAITGVNRGIVGIAGLPMDTVQNVLNLGKAAVGTIAGAVGRPDLMPELSRGNVGTSEWIAERLKPVGINTENPRPDDQASRMLYTAGNVVGGSMLPGVRPSAIPAAAGAAVAGEVSDNPLAPAVGSMLPGAAAQGFREVRTNQARRAAENIKTYEQAGVEPSAGLVTGNAFFAGLENLASKFPGGAGVMRVFTEKLQRDMGANTRTGGSAETAGRAIESGITRDGGFLDRTRQVWGQLDDALATKVGNAAVKPTNTLQALEELTSTPAGAENLGKILNNPKIEQFKVAINKDITGGNSLTSLLLPAGTETLPYSTLRQLRTRIGSMLDDSLVSDVPKGELKRLYRGITDDLKSAAEQAGAGREFNRQSQYYKARMDRVESVLERVVGSGKQPEDIFKTINPTDPNQANKLRAVMRSLDPSERKIVTDAVVERLGRATPGRQNELGDVFSSETFLTNWNKLSPGAKSQLFADGELRTNLDAVAKAAADIRESSKVFQNSSGTAGSFAAYSVYSSPIVALATASITPLLAAGGSAAAAFGGAKLLTNKNFVQWLAKTPEVRPENSAAYLARLGVIYNESKDEEFKRELSQYINAVK